MMRPISTGVAVSFAPKTSSVGTVMPGSSSRMSSLTDLTRISRSVPEALR